MRRPMRAIAIWLLAGSSGLAAGETSDAPPLEDVARASTAWSRFDSDKSGQITRREAALGGIEGDPFDRGDKDGDGAWSRDEFLVQYAQRCLRSSAKLAPDLEAEIVRIQALRRARHLAQVRRAAGGSGPAASRLAQIQAGPVCAALAELQAQAARGSMTRESLASARTALGEHASARLRGVSPQQRSRELAAWTEVQRELDRVENGVREPHEARASVEGLRSALVRNGWIQPSRTR